jgi:transposase
VVSTLTHTYAPKGQTPVITTSTEINLRLYVASAISPAGGLQYMIRKQPFDSEAIISYLEHLQQAFARRKLLIIWDSASIHDSDKIRTYLSAQKKKRLHLEKQPLYSPELNADEQVWSYLKQQLQNTCNQTAAVLYKRITQSMNALQQQPQLIQSFFHHPDLGFYN